MSNYKGMLGAMIERGEASRLIDRRNVMCLNCGNEFLSVVRIHDLACAKCGSRRLTDCREIQP